MKNIKKQLGIWLDYHSAIIMEAAKNDVNIVKVIPSEVDDFNVGGGAPAKVKWGLGEIVSDKRYLERRRKQENEYFSRVMDSIKDADELFIFGPAEAKKKLQTKIATSKDFRPELRKVETADSMTDNQKRAMVREFYHSV